MLQKLGSSRNEVLLRRQRKLSEAADGCWELKGPSPFQRLLYPPMIGDSSAACTSFPRVKAHQPE